MLTRRPCVRRRETLTRRARLRRLTAKVLLAPGWTRWLAVAPRTLTCWITVGAAGCVITCGPAPVIDALSATLMLGLFAAFDAMLSVAARSPTPLLPTKATVTRHELPGATGAEQPLAVNSPLLADRLLTVSGTWPVVRNGAEQPLAVNSPLLADRLLTVSGTWPVLRKATERVTLASSARRGGNASDVVLSEEKADGGGVAPAILPSTVNRSLNSPPVTSPVAGAVWTGGSPGPDTRMEFVPVGLPTTVCGVTPSPV